MNVTQAFSLARAMELDDRWPDDVCPGCYQNIAGWEGWECHYRPGDVPHRRDARVTIPMPFTSNATSGILRPCEWDSDYLNARRFRRRFIARYQQVAS